MVHTYEYLFSSETNGRGFLFGVPQVVEREGFLALKLSFTFEYYWSYRWKQDLALLINDHADFYVEIQPREKKPSSNFVSRSKLYSQQGKVLERTACL